MAKDCKFHDCTAEVTEGAIWTNEPVVVEECKFKDNQAKHGGTIYVASGKASITESVFEGNAVTVSDDHANVFIGNMVTVDGCGNDDLEDELGARCSSSTIARIRLVLSAFVGSLSLVMAL